MDFKQNGHIVDDVGLLSSLFLSVNPCPADARNYGTAPACGLSLDGYLRRMSVILVTANPLIFVFLVLPLWLRSR